MSKYGYSLNYRTNPKEEKVRKASNTLYATGRDSYFSKYEPKSERDLTGSRTIAEPTTRVTKQRKGTPVPMPNESPKHRWP